MWLKDGRALQDVLGNGYTLLDLAGRCETGPLKAAFRDLDVPLDVLCLDEPHIREVYGCTVLLLRPDLHIAWRGDNPPDSPATLVARATGWGETARQTTDRRRPAKVLEVHIGETTYDPRTT
jgi:hypothetical protein